MEEHHASLLKELRVSMRCPSPPNPVRLFKTFAAREIRSGTLPPGRL